jgi:serine/threonine protein kinase
MSELRLQQCRLDNRYDLLDCINRGSYAELFIARDAAVAESDPHRLVVVKALNPQLQGEIDPPLEQTLLENFRNEAVALDRVRHSKSSADSDTALRLILSGARFIT